MSNKLSETFEETTEVKETRQASKETKEVKQTLCKLVSRANYTISVLSGSKRIYIPPFGEATVIRENVKVEYDNDAKLLSFVKI